MMRDLTPYDTGERLEPFPRVMGRRMPAPQADPDEFGKVELEDDESKTIMTVWGQRGADGYELHVEPAFGEAIPVVQYPDLGRVMQLVTHPLPKDSILGLRETFATAEVDGHGIVFSHGFGFGATMMAIEVNFADGTRSVESVPMNEILQQWAKGLIDEHDYLRKQQEEKGA